MSWLAVSKTSKQHGGEAAKSRSTGRWEDKPQHSRCSAPRGLALHGKKTWQEHTQSSKLPRHLKAACWGLAFAPAPSWGGDWCVMATWLSAPKGAIFDGPEQVQCGRPTASHNKTSSGCSMRPFPGCCSGLIRCGWGSIFGNRAQSPISKLAFTAAGHSPGQWHGCHTQGPLASVHCCMRVAGRQDKESFPKPSPLPVHKQAHSGASFVLLLWIMSFVA